MVHYLLVVMLHFEVFHLVSGQIPARLKPSDHLLVLFFCKLGLAFQRTHEGGTMNRMIRPSRSQSSLLDWRTTVSIRVIPCSFSRPTRVIISWVVPQALQA